MARSRNHSERRVAQTAPARPRRSRTEPRFVRWLIIGVALAFLAIFLVLPLVTVFVQAFARGIVPYLNALTDPDAVAAIKLTLLVAAISVALNLVFGVVAAWAIAKFEFPGKSLLITLIDLPFSVSPVISGLVFVLLFGPQGFFGAWFLQAHDVKIIFALPGIVLATVLRDLPVRRARTDPADAGAGHAGGGGRALARRVRLADLLARDAAQCEMGAALRRAAVQRARHGRVRRGGGGLRPYPRRDQHHAAAYRDSLQRVPVHGVVRGRLAAGAARAGDADRQGRARRRYVDSCRSEAA